MLPNIVTIFGICVGLTAVRMALEGNINLALYLLVFAMILDAVDGRLARALQSESKIGAELDTLADFFNFGIATPLVIYLTIFADTAASRFGWIAVMVFSVCCALRLARFNVQSELADKKHFTGLPSPVAAALVAGFVWSTYPLNMSFPLVILGALMTATAGLLMVSNLRYPSFKEIDFRGRVPFFVILAVVMGFVVITIDPPRILFTIALVFSFSAPLRWVWAHFRPVGENVDSAK